MSRVGANARTGAMAVVAFVRLRRVAIIVVASALLAMSVWHCGRAGRDAAAIEPAGGDSQTRFHLSTTPIDLQTDPRWSQHRIGGSGQSLAAVGCVVCSLSMALADLGEALPPDALNERLKQAEGFTSRGWLIWGAVPRITDGRIEVEVLDQPSHAAIDAALSSGRPVLAKILLYGQVDHWVLIVGKDGREYLVKDPMGRGRTLDRLSGFGSRIYSIRIVRRVD